MARNILIADDVKMNRALLLNVLGPKLEGVTFFEAKDGNEVMEITEANEIDLILLDLIMPVKDGYTVLKELKANPKTADIPVIVNSAITDISSIEDTLRDGAADYFTKPLTKQDMDIILPLKARNALIVYEQKREIEKLNEEINIELKNANTFQNILLPKPQEFESVEIHMKYMPCLGIGGDYFDCVQKKDKLWVMIADVTGHGIAAGMASSMVKVMYRALIEDENIMPGKLLEAINRKVCELSEGFDNFNYLAFTTFACCIQGNKLTFSNASQPYPLILKKSDETIEKLDIRGPLIGMFDTSKYKEGEIELNSGDSLFMYTDGLFSSGEGSDFKNWVMVEEFANLFKDLAFKDGSAFLDKAYKHFKLMHMKPDGTDFTDDVAMLFVKYK